MDPHEVGLSGAYVTRSSRRSDERGTFSRLFCASELANILQGRKIVQINHSVTRRRGAVRGLHFQQPPFAEMKLVRCLRGSVWDVAVDLRKGSDTFLHWHAEELTPANEKMIVIPEGFAHGFQTLEADSELLYLHTEFYHPESEGGYPPTDARISIQWPLTISALSDRDASHAPVTDDFQGIAL